MAKTSVEYNMYGAESYRVDVDPGSIRANHSVWHVDGSDFWGASFRGTTWAQWLTELDAYKWIAKKQSDELDAAHNRIHDLEVELREMYRQTENEPARRSTSEVAYQP